MNELVGIVIGLTVFIFVLLVVAKLLDESDVI